MADRVREDSRLRRGVCQLPDALRNVTLATMVVWPMATKRIGANAKATSELPWGWASLN
jgi:hypothetical protein